MKKRISKNIEWPILICTILLVIIGLIALFSATQNAEYDEFKKQIMWIAISVPFIIAFVLVDYETIAKISPVFYVIMLILLVGVLFTQPINGATSWYVFSSMSFQPAEFSKIFVIIFLALIMSKMAEKGRKEISRPTRLLILCIILAIPLLLIIKQPDYGTGLAFCVAFIMMLFAAGIDKKYIITGFLLLAITLPLLYFFVLPDHAKKRIEVFLNQDLDPRGAGYNLTQSKLAIGAGELLGMGLLKGNQTQLGYLSPKTTDFIFSVIGEEMGFITTATIVIIYVILITKAIYVAKTAKDNLGSYIAIGIAGIFLFHMTENIGMTIGLLPITGVPLPFVSYGGTSYLILSLGIGITLNISSKIQAEELPLYRPEKQ